MEPRTAWRMFLAAVILGTIGAVVTVVVLVLNKGRLTLTSVISGSLTLFIFGIRRVILLPMVKGSRKPPPGGSPSAR